MALIVTTVKRLGFRSSSGIFSVTSGEVQAKIPGKNLKMHVSFSSRSTNPEMEDRDGFGSPASTL
ncbi:hypothetical protein HanRHA438_Chr09g0428601 [Helianthus annuus]|uniref:Uncharacterized protein n=1 Tax=Helianthus annuus TaxID=4232 RepID=A0A251U3J9_HELAN|nr:hypothetical protein HanXRQr2_Chr09g0416381 [Helianthus annuus]KAJ0528180.1 hypothetical protein HanHA300_Chr09g0342331 [Helianthus annuus]KAJ0544614.1 hypothetical protein HanHA89_Chr09g0363611 [Helianthus annuus]KAJ0709621.1 hypothetical protein HanLR1_Chr09g0342391 [Helianthus annuus]KAJ0890867.1 hypothetical protein HanRHA438_Chr09g0428601 [Helianthus annuus]